MGPNDGARQMANEGAKADDARTARPSAERSLRPDDELPKIHVRPATDADTAPAAALHSSQIAEGFLSFLGPRFLEHLYRRIICSSTSFLSIAEGDRRPVGFIAGSTDLAGLYRAFLLWDGVPAALAAGRRLVSSPRRAWETLTRGPSTKARSNEAAELLAVAVDPDWRGRGAGRLLVEAFLEEAGRRGHGSARVVVAAHNRPAIAMYEDTGFVPVERFELHAGTPSLVMTCDEAQVAARKGESPT